MAARLVGLFFLVACSGGEHTRPDHVLYMEATQAGSATPEARLEMCSQMSDKAARGDCGSIVVLSAAREKHPDPETLCPLVEEGTWRYECLFQVAEHWRRRKRMDRAVGLCKEAGPFVRDCGQHMWQTELRALSSSGDPLPSLLLKAEDLFVKWEGFFADDEDASTDFSQRYWRHFYQHFVKPSSKVDMRLCEGLSAFHRQHCRRSLGALYLRKVQQIVRHPHEMSSFCGVQSDQLDSVLAGSLQAKPYRAEPDPLLLEVLTRVYEHACVRKEALPIRSNWLLQDENAWFGKESAN